MKLIAQVKIDGGTLSFEHIKAKLHVCVAKIAYKTENLSTSSKKSQLNKLKQAFQFETDSDFVQYYLGKQDDAMIRFFEVRTLG